MPLRLVTLCSGNAARSVMLGYMLSTLADANGEAWSIRTAGTHVVEGAAMSARTRDALLGISDLGDHHYNAHRSHQLNFEDAMWADAILACEASHVNFVREHFGATTKSVVLGQFLREAPLDVPFDEQVRYVASLEPLAYFNVEDPAGGDQAAYNACATTLWEMAQAFSTLVVSDERP